MLAARDSLIHLHQPAAGLLPKLKLTDVTIADLIAHTSGLATPTLLSLAGLRDLDHYTAADLRTLAYRQRERAVAKGGSSTATPTTSCSLNSSKLSTAPIWPTSPVAGSSTRSACTPPASRPIPARPSSVPSRLPAHRRRLAAHPDPRCPARPRHVVHHIR